MAEQPTQADEVDAVLNDAGPKKETEVSIDCAELRRLAGNKCFKDGDIAGARKDYEETLRILNKLCITNDLVAESSKTSATDAQSQAKTKECRLPTLLNLALCCLRAEPCEAARALELCEEALELDPENAKACYRKGKALIELQEFAEANWEMTRACKLAPKDKTLRQELDQLRKRMEGMKKQDQDTYKGLFDRQPGFASEGRAESTAAAKAKSRAKSDEAHKFLKEPAENPYINATQPHEEASALQKEGKLEEATWAWKAAVLQSMSEDHRPERARYWLELAKLSMDLNIDSIALNCLHSILNTDAADTDDDNGPGRIPATLRKDALLIQSICLLNEDDPAAEITECIEAWLAQAEVGPSCRAASPSSLPLEERLASMCKGAASGGSDAADAAVAHGLLLLIRGSASVAVQSFADALRVPAVTECCFRVANRWNMLGAVLANLGRSEQAIVAYDRALSLQPHYPRALINKAIALQAKEDPRGAAEAYAAAFTILPSWCLPPYWPAFLKVAEEMPSSDALVEAARKANLTKVLEILGANRQEQSQPREEMPVYETLMSMGLVAGPAGPSNDGS